MSTFTLAISCLTTSNLPWFVYLTFQLPVQYCSLQHQTLLLSPVTSTTGYCFCFGSIPSLFLQLFLHWSPVPHWAPTTLEISSFNALSFCLFISSWSSQGKNTEMLCHSLLQWSMFCQNSPPWPIHLGWPYTARLMVQGLRSDRQSTWRTMDRGSWRCTGGSDQDHHQEKEIQKFKMVVSGGLINSWEKKRSKGEKERYIHLNAEFQRITRRDKKAFLRD